MRKSLIALAAVLAVGFGANAQASEGATPPIENWSWTGFFGSFDKASAQRGLQVYTEVCSSCHSLKRVHYRNLTELGYSEDAVKEFAAQFEVEDGPNDDGEMFTRPAKPSDHFVSPFPNEQAARVSNGGALPPDLSLIIKSRAHGQGNIVKNFGMWLSGRGTASGADYVYHLLTGYKEAGEAEAYMREKWDEEKAAGVLTEEQIAKGFSFHLPEGKHFNEWFAGHAISMPKPLDEEYVEYADGTPATLEQEVRDVVTFLAWASEPELEMRKEMGLKVLLFLVVLLGLAIAAKRRLWAGIKH
ncbi:cytochrome c1 [Aestuariispira ectoiniformans]|uniref:cytochrome c1 n=1 Tax=Aestuariispira ectoiniformans TaxID=2775080 RepID=UPI00223C1429|nr:cytochrome c1 [Aestuariispira ectoiniformans]